MRKWWVERLPIWIRLRLRGTAEARAGCSVAAMPFFRGAAAVAALFLSLGFARAAHGQTMIASCETATLDGWTFLDGSDFPGAKGSLTSAPGHSGSSARLAYDFSEGGKYVGATIVLPSPVRASAVALWVRAPLGVAALLQLEDASGQTLEYRLPRPLEASFDADAWYRVVVDVAAPSRHFNGNDDGIAQLPFSRIAVLALPESGTTGWVDFDEITALDDFHAKVDPDAQPAVAAPLGAADLASRLAVNLHSTRDERELDIARDAGFSAVRLDLVWSSVERSPGVYDFSEFDALLPSLTARGMRLHLIIDYSNDLYPPLDSPQFQTTTLPAFAAVARAFAARFAGRDVSYEIWNEPNSERFWPTSVGPSGFAALCNVTAEALHQGDPLARVCIGGLAGFDYEFLGAILAGGAARGADAIGVHPYRQEGAESVGYDLLRFRSFVSQRASPAPLIWSTEWGYSSTWEGDGHGAVERARQAQLVAREALSAWAVGFPLIVIYNLRDDGVDASNAEHNFGLVQSDYAEKPALVAVRTLSRLARGRAFAGLLNTGFSLLHAMKFDGANDTVIALWSEYVGRLITVDLPTNASVVSFLGERRSLATTANGQQLTLQEADGPVYVTLTGRAVAPTAGATSTAGASSATAGAGSGGDSRVEVSPAAGGSAGIGGGPSEALAGYGAGEVPPSRNASPDSGCACALSEPVSWQVSFVRIVAAASFASLVWIRRRRRATSAVSARKAAN